MIMLHEFAIPVKAEEEVCVKKEMDGSFCDETMHKSCSGRDGEMVRQGSRI